MEIAVKVISAILKSVAGNKIGNEFGNEIAGIFIDEVTGKGINEIKNFINKGKVKIEHILSKENMESMNIPEDNIDYVIAEIKDLFSRIDITDEVFRQCKYDSMNLSAFLWDEYSENKTDFIEYEGDINRCLFAVTETLNKLIREGEKFDNTLMIRTSNTVDDIQAEMRKEFGIVKDNQKIIMQKNNEEKIINQDKKIQNNKKQEYIKIWNSRLFLHVDNDENPITLKEAFIMPDCKICKEMKKIGFSSDDTLDKIIEKFVKYDKTSTMLIYGVPGIGKSTITSWLANKYMNNDEYIILRFRDWDNEELEVGLLKSICNTLMCKKKDLEYKIFILDGFDEMKALDIREKILNSFFNDIKDFDNLKFIMTSRTGYIDLKNFQNVCKLQSFSIIKIEKFCKRITGKELNNKKNVKSNLEVLGIPVILYMAIMSNVDISESSTKPELYNRVFAEKGGIFDRFFDGNVEYGKGKQILRNPENIKKYLKFLRETAFQMFEENSLSLQRKECKIPELEFENKAISILEFPIKHLFENAETNIEFIHKSIYEYFVSEYIFVSICEAINTGISKENFAGILGRDLKGQILSSEILEFLRFKIRHSELDDKFDIVFRIFRLMLQDGMTYHTSEIFKEYYKNIVNCEMNVFANMLEILHLWKICYIELGSSVDKYIRYNYMCRLNLRKVNLKKVNLSEAVLREANLEEANLEGLDLREINLNKADLRKVNLKKVNLSEAVLREANLEEANLEGADLRRAKLNGANLNRANLNGGSLNGVNLSESDLSGADLSGADLSGANLIGTNLSGADLRKANLIVADLRKANLIGTNLSGADLRKADLSRADLSRASLRGANLRGTNLSGTNLSGTIIDESNIRYLENNYNLELTKIIISTQDIITYEEYHRRKH